MDKSVMEPGKLAAYHQRPARIGKKALEKQVKKAGNNDDEDLDPEEKLKRDQRYLNVLNDLARLRDHYYAVYLEKLEKKVTNQRKTIAAREERIRNKLLKENQKKAELAHKFVQRLPHHKLQHDSDFLRKVPKSRFYHLTAVEELMKSRGVLKHSYQIDEFWEKAKSDRSFWIKPIPASISPDALTEHMLSRYSSLTNQSKQGLPHATATPSVGILKKEQPHEKERSVDDESPIVFPEQPKFPKLNSFKLNLKSSLEIPPSLAQSSDSATKDVRGRNKQHRRRKLHRQIKYDAYNLAVVNTTMANRLLQNHSLRSVELQPLSEISEIWCGHSETSSISTATISKSVSSRTKKTGDRTRAKQRNVKLLDEITEDTEANTTKAEESSAANEKVQPLTMDMMLASDNVALMDAHRRNALWVNYAAEE